MLGERRWSLETSEQCRESEKAGDVNWMMIQQVSDEFSSADRHEDWRCSGTSVSCKSEHDSRVDSHAESDHTISNPNITEALPTQQNTIDFALQPETRLASVNLVILSNTAKLVVDSGCFDHCCPLDFASQVELREGRFLNASAANTIKLKHYGTRVVEGWARDADLGASSACEDEEKKVLSSAEKNETARAFQLCSWTTRSCTTLVTRMQRSHSSR